MSAVDWRSEQDYANVGMAEGPDIAWEWLRRDSEFEQDFKNLTADAQSGGVRPVRTGAPGLLFHIMLNIAFDAYHRRVELWGAEVL